MLNSALSGINRGDRKKKNTGKKKTHKIANEKKTQEKKKNHNLFYTPILKGGPEKIKHRKRKNGKKKKPRKLPRKKTTEKKKNHNLFYTPIRKVVSFLYLNSKNNSKQISSLTTECILFKYSTLRYLSYSNTNGILFVAFVEDNATISSTRYFENHASYFVQNRRK